MGVKKKSDKSNVKKMLDNINFLSNLEIEVGIFGDSFKDGQGNLTIFGKAVVNEYGATIQTKNGNTITIPERSFIRGSYDSNRDKIYKSLDNLVDDLLNNNISQSKFATIIGESSVDMIKEYIKRGVSPNNSPVTLERKKGSTPLIDTQEMFNNIEWRIV